MKKAISIVCIVALLVTSIGMTFINVAAEPITAPNDAADTVIWSTFTDDDGNDWYPYGPSDAPIPENVISSGSGSIIKDTTGLPSTGLFSIPTEQYNENGDPITESILCTDPISVSGINGIMVYVKVPEVEGGYNLNMRLRIYDASQDKFGYKNRNTATAYYYMAMGDNSFTSASYDSTSTNTLVLESGFEGYVYYLLNECTHASGFTKEDLTDDDAFAGLHFTLTAVEGEELIVGTPIAVKGTRDSVLAAPTDTIVVGGLTYKLDGSGLVEDDSDYVKPNFSGLTTATAPDATIINTPSTVYVTTTPVDSITPLISEQTGTIPQLDRNVNYGLETTANIAMGFNYSESVSFPSNGGFMYYLDFSGNQNTQILFSPALGTNASSLTANDSAIVGANNSQAGSGNAFVYLLWDNAAESNTWTAQALPDYSSSTVDAVFGNKNGNKGITLPVGFKGYIYIPENCYQLEKAFTVVTIYLVSKSGGADASKTYKVSAPMIVSDFDINSTLVSGDNCVLDLDTGKKIGAPDYTVSDTFYGDAAQIHVNSAPTVRPATMARPDMLYHPLCDLGALNNSKYFNATYNLGVSSGTNRTGGGVQVTIEDKFVPIIDDLPAVKVATTENFASTEGLVTFVTNDTITKDAGVLLYIKNHDAVEKKLYATMSDKGYRTANDFYIKKLGKDDSYWSYVDVDKSAVTFAIPANFEGYLYFNFEGFSGITALLADEVANASSLVLKNFVLCQQGQVAGQTMTVSFPMIVTNSPVSSSDANDFCVSPVAYVNDAEVPQNLNTDNFAIPYDHNGDLKVNVLDLARAYSEQTSDYALLRKNYLNVAEDAELVIANPS